LNPRKEASHHKKVKQKSSEKVELLQKVTTVTVVWGRWHRHNTVDEKNMKEKTKKKEKN
jgi:hypothetical protein